MANIIEFNPVRAVDLNGIAIPGALATFFDSGTSRVRTVYTDPDCTVPHPTPIAADGAGVFPPIYNLGDEAVRVIVTDSTGVVLAGYPMDPAIIVSTENSGAVSVSFSPTEQIPATNVQAAIESVFDSIVDPLADFGLGVTGNATVLSNLDSTGTASGFYQFNETTVGTFPEGVTAGTGGIVMIFRRTSNSAIMWLWPKDASRIHRRKLDDNSWSSWGRFMDSADTASAAIWSAGTSTAPYTATPAGIRAAVNGGSVGGAQSWVGVTSSRTVNTSYTNNTGRPIMVAIAGDAVDGGISAQVSANGSAWVPVGRFGEVGLMESSVNFIVPNGHHYRVNGNVNLLFWSELR